MLFGKAELPRSKPLKRMTVVDAGEHCMSGGKGIVFECPHCGHNTGWIADMLTVTENKRGIPRPKCNTNPATE